MENILNILNVTNNVIKELVSTLSLVVSFFITFETLLALRDKRITSKKEAQKKKKGDAKKKSKGKNTRK